MASNPLYIMLCSGEHEKLQMAAMTFPVDPWPAISLYPVSSVRCVLESGAPKVSPHRAPVAPAAGVPGHHSLRAAGLPGFPRGGSRLSEDAPS